MKQINEAIHTASAWPLERSKAIWENIIENGLWKRMLKIVIATSLANAIMLIPAVDSVIGGAAYLAGITTAFGHPGRRFGQMTEALILATVGTTLGVGWSILGLYLGSLLIYTNPPAAYTIRAIFLIIAFLIHGYFRSHTPRLFLGTVLWIIVTVVSLVSPAKVVTSTSATQILYPILTAVAILLLVNLCIFPEFSSTFLGTTTVNTLDEMSKTLNQASEYFLGIHLDNRKSDSTEMMIKDVTESKIKIRGKLSSCKVVQGECTFELAFSVIEPFKLKKISDTAMAKLTLNIIAMINACESRFALVGDDLKAKGDSPEKQEDLSDSEGNRGNEVAYSSPFARFTENPSSLPSAADDLQLVKPRREIEFGDPALLRDLTEQISLPCRQLLTMLLETVNRINANIAYTYHVSKLPDGSAAPKNVLIEEIDDSIERTKNSIDYFDRDIQAALHATEDWAEIREEFPDIMPREEIFLISSFYLNMRQSALHICEMLEHSRDLVDEFQKKNARRRLYAPHINWRKWLYTGGEEDQPAIDNDSLQIVTREKTHEDDDLEDDSKHLIQKGHHLDRSSARNDPESGAIYRKKRKTPSDSNVQSRKGSKTTPPLAMESSRVERLRDNAADFFEWIQHSHDIQYAFKVCIAAFLTLWPAFVTSWNTWFSLNRGLWAALQLVMITEPTFGSSINTFILRAVGTTFGCLWGWAAYEARNGNRVVCGVVICIGTIPASYVVVGSKYVKAGIVTIVSITVVSLATELATVPGSATENFLKRFLAFTIGAVVALVVAVALFPVKARTRMVEALSRSIGHIAEMENCVAFGIESPNEKHILTPPTIKRFDRATLKAKAALQTVDGLVSFCRKEPRLKGSFDDHLAIYKEIAFVLHQIIDRMDNMIVLRTAYGSGPLSLYNTQIFRYRRNLAGSIVLTLFAVQEALTTRLPLPQFLPSCRLAQLRVINRVREVVQDDASKQSIAHPSFTVRKQAARQNWLSWNAGSMAQAEVVEYLEELCDLTKLLVGANEFRSGLLTRPTYREYVYNIENLKKSTPVLLDGESQPENQERVKEEPKQNLTKRRTTTLGSVDGGENTEVPYSLRRIQSKRQEATLKRQDTWKSQKAA